MSRPRLAMLVAAIEMVDPGVTVPVTRTHGQHPPLLHCGPAPVLSKNADTTFRADLTSALAQLPSATAAKRDAFATVQIGNAFARGACFVANVSTSPATTRACEACLSAAAREVTGGCRTSERAGVWRNECFLSYADSNASTAHEDAFRGWFNAGPSTAATLADGGTCLTDRAVDCDRCWEDSARAAEALGWWQKMYIEEVIVVGYNCFLRVQISALPKGPEYGGGTVVGVIFGICLHLLFQAAAISLGILLIRVIMLACELPQVNNG